MNDKQKHQEKWRKKYPLRYLAHSLVFSALKSKKLKRKKCFCGEEKTEAHHKDYTEPLKVVWLCKRHHSEADKKMKVMHRISVDTDSGYDILEKEKSIYKNIMSKRQKNMLTKKEVLTRMNSRIRPDQKKLIRAEAKKLKITEGEVHRRIVDFYFNNNKK